jgi:hypothetical protein
VIAAHAYVAADAFSNVVDIAVLDFLRQEGVGDGGSRGADEIQNAAPLTFTS